MKHKGIWAEPAGLVRRQGGARDAVRPPRYAAEADGRLEDRGAHARQGEVTHIVRNETPSARNWLAASTPAALHSSLPL